MEWVADDEKVSAVGVFTDGSPVLLVNWPQVATSAGWAAVFSQRLSDKGSGDLWGAAFGQLTVHAEHRAFWEAVATATSVAEISA